MYVASDGSLDVIIICLHQLRNILIISNRGIGPGAGCAAISGGRTKNKVRCVCPGRGSPQQSQKNRSESQYFFHCNPFRSVVDNAGRVQVEVIAAKFPAIVL